MAKPRPPRRRAPRPDRNGLATWSALDEAAWIGFLEAHKSLTRELEAELVAEHGLGISGMELLVRLARAEGTTMRLSVLAEAAGLSLSRVSRIVDRLEGRGLVERHPDPTDTRATLARLTEEGIELSRASLRTHFAGVERLFFDRIAPEDVETLARVFAPFRR